MLEKISTGHSELDHVIDHLRLGDNVVWQIDDLDRYRRYVNRFVRRALEQKRPLYYFRFGSHRPLIGDDLDQDAITICKPRADAGFENFASEVHSLIKQAGLGAFYVFDCLSDLLESWSSDLMIGNFFRITCPYLFKLDTVAWFCLMRGQHSFDTIARIRDTTQLLLDLYHIGGHDYLHPLKVWQRYSPSMFLPHSLDDDSCRPLTSSADAAALFASVQTRAQQAERQIDFWDRLFLTAEQASEICEQQDPESDPYCQRIFDRLCGLLVGDSERINDLIHRWLTLADLIDISRRQIASGKIGGKAVGMLLARKIADHLMSSDSPLRPEPHDSYYLGSDLFYTYIVHNDCWQLRMEQKTPEGYFTKAAELQEQILRGSFPESIRESFQQLLEYYGQSPIIVRSSSLLEDDFGNAFAGKYESVFCASQGTPQDRSEKFEQAVRQVYASMFDESALTYRLQRGLDTRDEQMALLVQRVSGSYHGRTFFPLAAGVAHSRNLYVWDSKLDPGAGAARLVYGLGTRAVDRVEGDYPKMVALDQPQLSVHSSRDDERSYSQRQVDVLDLGDNSLKTVHLNDLLRNGCADDLSEVADVDWEQTRQLKELRISHNEQWIVNFRKLLADGSLAAELHRIIRALEDAYGWPVDIEFTINRSFDGRLMLSLLQCRPLQTRQLGAVVSFPDVYDKSRILLQSQGGFMGGNISINTDHVIYIDPVAYNRLSEQKRHQTARIIGMAARKLAASGDPKPVIMLIGPGRWGTSTPSLGIPVRFSEICDISILVEAAFEAAGMIPEISFGSHFFLDLVETGIFYIAVMPAKGETLYRPELLLSRDNRLSSLLPEWSEYQDVVHVIETIDRPLKLLSDISSQRLLVIE